MFHSDKNERKNRKQRQILEWNDEKILSNLCDMTKLEEDDWHVIYMGNMVYSDLILEALATYIKGQLENTIVRNGMIVLWILI